MLFQFQELLRTTRLYLLAIEIEYNDQYIHYFKITNEQKAAGIL